MERDEDGFGRRRTFLYGAGTIYRRSRAPGARAILPENTIPAFEYAIQSGVDVLELDMAVSRDGVIVVSHDPYLRPPTCKGPQASAVIHQSTLADIRKWDCGSIQNPRFPKQQTRPGTRMPTLEEVSPSRRAAASSSTSRRRASRTGRS